MKVAEHIELIRDTQESLAAAVKRFAKEHHEDCDCWFELEWGMVLIAFDDEERTAALDKLADRYKELNP